MVYDDWRISGTVSLLGRLLQYEIRRIIRGVKHDVNNVCKDLKSFYLGRFIDNIFRQGQFGKPEIS